MFEEKTAVGAFGAASRFTGPSLPETRDELVPLELLWGRSGACLRERLLEARTPADNSTTVDVTSLHMTLDGMAFLPLAGRFAARGDRVE